MKRKVLNIMIFILSIICLIISIKLFYNLGIYSDEFNTSPDIVLGGEVWLYMNWFSIPCMALIAVLSCITLFKNRDE